MEREQQRECREEIKEERNEKMRKQMITIKRIRVEEGEKEIKWQSGQNEREKEKNSHIVCAEFTVTSKFKRDIIQQPLSISSFEFHV